MPVIFWRLPHWQRVANEIVTIVSKRISTPASLPNVCGPLLHAISPTDGRKDWQRSDTVGEGET